MDDFTANELAVGLRKMADSKSSWLDKFSSGPKKRPDGEIETQRAHLRVLVTAAKHSEAIDEKSRVGG